MTPSIARVAALALVLGLAAAGAGREVRASDLPTTYRLAFQPVRPLGDSLATGAYVGVHATPDLDLRTLQFGLPGFQGAIVDGWSWTAYLLTVWDRYDARPDRLELRPTVGLKLERDVDASTDWAIWGRLEARFQDVTGDASYTTRAKLRASLAHTLGGAGAVPGAWYAMADVEPAWVLNRGGYLSGTSARLGLGRVVAPGHAVDLRVIQDYGRSRDGADFGRTGYQVKLTWNVFFGRPHRSPVDVD